MAYREQSRADVLYAPSVERVATSNAWAFLHWLRATGQADLAAWSDLQRFSSEKPAVFKAALAEFARLPDRPMRLARHHGNAAALVLRDAKGGRLCLSEQALAANEIEGLPAGIAVDLAREFPPAALAHALADLLLFADLRPDDRLLIAGARARPWLAALLEGTTVILGDSTPRDLLAMAAEEGATVIAAAASRIAEAAVRRSGHRPDLGALRSIVAEGNPLSPEARARVYAWIKPDVLLLARSGGTLWGSPLGPVLARPPGTPGFFRPRSQARQRP